MLRRLTSVAFVALGLLATNSCFALERVQDGFPERAVLMQKVRALFLRNDFAALEKLAVEMRAGSRFTDGCWQLATFYKAFAPSPAAPETLWEDWFRRIERWENATPTSVTPRFVKVEGWAVHASPATAGTPKSPTKFSESAAKAREILESIPRAEPIRNIFT